jgi:hypothetical protein
MVVLKTETNYMTRHESNSKNSSRLMLLVCCAAGACCLQYGDCCIGLVLSYKQVAVLNWLPYYVSSYFIPLLF